MRRQQNWMRTIASQVMRPETLTNPVRLNEFLQTATRAVAVDEGFTMTEMRSHALGMRDVRKSHPFFPLAPTAGSGRERNGTAWASDLDKGLLDEIGHTISQDRFGVSIEENQDRPDRPGVQVR